VWYGGRLAVLHAYRHSAASIGAALCRLAEATVIAHGCRQFLAYIQIQNVRFFQRLADALGILPDYVLAQPGPNAPPAVPGADLVVIVGRDYQAGWVGQ
jgi:hypothetical protein